MPCVDLATNSDGVCVKAPITVGGEDFEVRNLPTDGAGPGFVFCLFFPGIRGFSVRGTNAARVLGLLLRHLRSPEATLSCAGFAQVSCISMGNPHAIVFVPDLAALDFDRLGPLFEVTKHHPKHGTRTLPSAHPNVCTVLFRSTRASRRRSTPSSCRSASALPQQSAKDAVHSNEALRCAVCPWGRGGAGG